MAETKAIEQLLTETETRLTAEAKQAATEAAKAETTELKTKLETTEKELVDIKAWKVIREEADKKNQDWIDSEIAGGKRGKAEPEAKTFNQILSETIERNADKIQNFRKGQGHAAFDLLPEVKSDGKEREVKVVGDMSITANFPAADTIYGDRLSRLIETPVNRVDIAALLPSGNGTGTSINYPRENGVGEGGVDVWTTGDKAAIDWDFIPVNAPYKTIAGVVIIERFMLDDIPFLNSFIQSRMLLSLINARNSLILNGNDTAPALEGLQDVATDYNGQFTGNTTTLAIKKLVDAAYGQIPNETHDWYRGNLIILNTRDQVNIGLNTATGSGEFDLPLGSVAFSNGNLSIGGLRTVGVSSPTMPENTFYAIDTSATMVITRMAPELRMFESADLARVNKVMFRIEQRVTALWFNEDALVKGVLLNS